MFWKPCSRSISSIFPCFSSIGWSSAFSSIGWSSTFSNKKQRKRTLLESLLSKFGWKLIISKSNSPSKGSPYPSTGPTRVSILGTFFTFWITIFSVLSQIRWKIIFQKCQLSLHIHGKSTHIEAPLKFNTCTIITRQVSKTWLVYLGDVPALPLPVVVQVHHVQVRTGRGAPRWLPLKIVIFQMLPPMQHSWLFSPLFLISFLFHVHSRPSKWRSRLERNALNWDCA